MSENTSAAMATSPPSSTAGNPAPRVGFVSLGCPKALTDSELILTRLSAEGYETSKTFEGADLVIVNTCGFIDDAVRESLDTIGFRQSPAFADWRAIVGPFFASPPVVEHFELVCKSD